MDIEGLLKSLNARAVEYDVTDLSVDDLLTHKILVRQYIVETDVHPFVAGATFDAVWERKVLDRYGQTPAAFASLEDLIAMKRAAGRPKDLEDLKLLARRSAPPPKKPPRRRRRRATPRDSHPHLRIRRGR